MTRQRTYRIESIDLLRGVVMILMALDHARVFIGLGSFYSDPTNLATTTPMLFFTRWITHFCAPVFVFLAGTSAFLYGTRRASRGEVSRFLLTRGLWLIFLELTVVNFAWTFDVTLSVHILQVIWAIGISMVFLAALIFLPRAALLLTGVVLIAGHNLLDGITITFEESGSVLWYLLHQRSLAPLPDGGAIIFAYPVIPWIGLMVLGYAFGELYKTGSDPARRRRWLLRLGWGGIVAFVIIRAINIYGDLTPWAVQDSLLFTIMSFVNTTKYPPSLLYLLMTIGPSLLFLAATERIKNRVTDALVVVGRVPLFYYVIHLYMLHIAGVAGVVLSGRPWGDMIVDGPSFLSGLLSSYGYGLPAVYAVWLAVVLALFPLCFWYNAYKSRHRDRWWLSYL